jgi:hypothetical protein
MQFYFNLFIFYSLNYTIQTIVHRQVNHQKYFKIPRKFEFNVANQLHKHSCTIRSKFQSDEEPMSQHITSLN